MILVGRYAVSYPSWKWDLNQRL